MNSSILSHWKLLACDLDGTLIGWNHRINDGDLEALRRARDAGLHIAICTGRNSRESAGIIADLQFEAPHGLGVFVNGAMVCDMTDGRSIHSTFMPDSLALDLVNFFGSQGHAVLILADDPDTRLPLYCLTDHGPPHLGTVAWLAYNRLSAHAVSEPPPHFRGRIIRVGTVVNTDQAPTLQIGLQQFSSRAATHSIYSPHYDCQVVEAFHPSVNKWTGILHLAESMRIPPATIITIGDDINDLPMLQNAPLSFAMGDAAPHIQAAAKRITLAQKDCGVAHIIDQLLARQLEP